MADTKKFKDYFDEDLVFFFIESFSLEPSFRASTFKELAMEGLLDLEMKERVAQIAEALYQSLSGTPVERIEAVQRALPLPRDEQNEEPINNGFRLWPLGEFIARYGLAARDESFTAMLELTKRFTSEFAIRPFLEDDPEWVLQRFETLLHHDNHHVRRWVSEGTRTRLPWAKKIPALLDYQEERIALLSALRNDESRYVARSVANHLQDILKDDLPRGLELAKEWRREDKEITNWIIRHGCRNLLKEGHPEVMTLFGYEPNLIFQHNFYVSPLKMQAGDDALLSLELSNGTSSTLEVRVDYILEGPTKTGRTFRKIFRWSDLSMKPQESKKLEKAHPFRHLSTRKVYSGPHRFTPLVNGVEGQPLDVILI